MAFFNMAVWQWLNELNETYNLFGQIHMAVWQWLNKLNETWNLFGQIHMAVFNMVMWFTFCIEY